jgi:cytochrome c-type biogenesis protein CcmE
MKKTHIILLVLIAAAIVVLISYTGDLSSYETVSSAKQKQGKFVNLIVKMDKTVPVQYDPVKDPNYLKFNVQDSLGGKISVVYHNTMPTDMEKSERLVLKGKVQGDVFECSTIVMKCPSNILANIYYLANLVIFSHYFH